MEKFNVGDHVIAPNDYKGIIIYIVPPHEWPHDHYSAMDASAKKLLGQDKWNIQLILPSPFIWKKWRSPAYIVAKPPHPAYYTSGCTRAKEEDLEYTRK